MCPLVNTPTDQLENIFGSLTRGVAMVAMVAIDDRTRIASSQGSRVDIHVPPRPSAWNLCAPWLATAGRDHTARQYPFACNDAHAASEEHASYRDGPLRRPRTLGPHDRHKKPRAMPPRARVLLFAGG